MEVHVMKKYNTPEMKVSMFNEESVLTLSNGFATYDAFVNENTGNVTVLEKDWETLKTEINIQF